MILLKTDQDLKNMILPQALAAEMRSREGKKAEAPLPPRGPVPPEHQVSLGLVADELSFTLGYPQGQLPVSALLLQNRLLLGLLLPLPGQLLLHFSLPSTESYLNKLSPLAYLIDTT